MQYIWLFPLGIIVGAFGTLIGAGGGFILMPVLLLLYPNENPELLTSISLAVVFFNALSGSLAYARMGRVDYRSGLMFSLATIPGAILGALTTSYIPRRLFDLIFGLLMITASAYLLLRPTRKKQRTREVLPAHYLKRELIEADGTNHAFSYNPIVGIVLSFFVGFFSSLLGIGGGIVHVPALVNLLNFPVHIATATSHFILAIMALTGTGVHVAMGTFSRGTHRTILLGIGALLGAQAGARLSNRVTGDWIIRGLAIALGFVGVRILMIALQATV